MGRYDIAIIGTGPAGLEAAITATIRNKSVLLLGSAQLSEKINKAHLVKNYLGLPETGGEKLKRAFLDHINELGIQITDARVSNVYSMGDYFALQTGDINNMLEARTVILATGVSQTSTLDGEERLLGRGVSYCATCDAPLYKGKRVAVIGYSPAQEEEADFLAEVASSVIYFPVYKGDINVKPQVKVIREKPVSIRQDLRGFAVVTATGEYQADGTFVLRESIAPDKLVPGLELDGNHVKVDLNMRTNIPGLYAAGDVTGTPYQYIKAAGQGNVASLSAVSYLAEQDRK
ncbi:MAG: NAD(P)/FAD-dependent oxidoreductase [Eubacteriales bacterium]|nr:NAD(P)/FAD-dependent oxidoreductase [Eubacteriales bacterium]